jgi:hypothetical protein
MNKKQFIDSGLTVSIRNNLESVQDGTPLALNHKNNEY